MTGEDTFYDKEREHSMADEGGYAGAQMESEDHFEKIMSIQKEIRTWLETLASLGLLGFAAYCALRDLRKKDRPRLRIVPKFE